MYNYNGGPCYRCLHPVPPPAETVTNCSDGGVLGVGRLDYPYERCIITKNCTCLVPGVIGTLQALEAIKIITGSNGRYMQRGRESNAN